MTYRGKNLGDHVSEEQYDEIDKGTFRGMFTGDYWVINGFTWRIADFDYWYKTCVNNDIDGRRECIDHHVLIWPDRILYRDLFTDEMYNPGGMIASNFYTKEPREQIINAFGMEHLLVHFDILINSINDTNVSTGIWVKVISILPNEKILFGSNVMSNMNGYPRQHIIMNSNLQQHQLALTNLYPLFVRLNKDAYYLSDIVDFNQILYHSETGVTGIRTNNHSLCGIRPIFAICKSSTLRKE